mmetsp:Transcript_14131/g.41573  ORF Transcript_14131/g.41573 Transcript_14131/m.41573 type:complete len:212 (-) Transcript_14131:928-1563(-)
MGEGTSGLGSRGADGVGGVGKKRRTWTAVEEVDQPNPGARMWVVHSLQTPNPVGGRRVPRSRTVLRSRRHPPGSGHGSPRTDSQSRRRRRQSQAGRIPPAREKEQSCRAPPVDSMPHSGFEAYPGPRSGLPCGSEGVAAAAASTAPPRGLQGGTWTHGEVEDQVPHRCRDPCLSPCSRGRCSCTGSSEPRVQGTAVPGQKVPGDCDQCLRA